MIKVEPKHAMLCIGLMFLSIYVGLYLVMSRRAYAEADRDQLNGFYYFTPENTKDWRFHERLVGRVFWPLNFVDRLLGTGRSQGSAPLWDLSVATEYKLEAQASAFRSRIPRNTESGS